MTAGPTPSAALDPLPHTASTAPFEPYAIEKMTPEQERVFLASQSRLMWWKFKKHKLALISGIFIITLYAMVLICEWLAPYHYSTRHTDFIRAPRQEIHLFHEGNFVGPFVYGYNQQLNMENLKREYEPNRKDVQKLRFFCEGDPYYFWGLIPGKRRLVCPAEGGTLFLLGTDRLGRDMLSRMIYGGRVSLTIGLIGVSVDFTPWAG